jgi:hypothetical protein
MPETAVCSYSKYALNSVDPEVGLSSACSLKLSAQTQKIRRRTTQLDHLITHRCLLFVCGGGLLLWWRCLVWGFEKKNGKQLMPSTAKTGGKREIAQSRSSSYRAARLRDFPDLAKAKSCPINRAFCQSGPIIQPCNDDAGQTLQGYMPPPSLSPSAPIAGEQDQQQQQLFKG